MTNPALKRARVYDGRVFPFERRAFDGCVSNYVLEHIHDPAIHFAEVARVLKPGGVYCFRTPNQWHYVALAAKMLPHSAHRRLANRVRGLSEDAHDPWPTVYRANTPGQVRGLCEGAGLELVELRMIEKEPSYGRWSPWLFFPMMLYERVVNSSGVLRCVRANILGVVQKPS
jgi:SAM-dependent methyltransferase